MTKDKDDKNYSTLEKIDFYEERLAKAIRYAAWVQRKLDKLRDERDSNRNLKKKNEKGLPF